MANHWTMTKVYSLLHCYTEHTSTLPSSRRHWWIKRCCCLNLPNMKIILMFIQNTNYIEMKNQNTNACV